MPYKDNKDKVDYQRLYMRRKRRSVGSNSVLDPPYKRVVRPQDSIRLTKAQLEDYMRYLARSDKTIVRTSRGYEMVNLGTGELKESHVGYVLSEGRGM